MLTTPMIASGYYFWGWSHLPRTRLRKRKFVHRKFKVRSFQMNPFLKRSKAIGKEIRMITLEEL